MATSLNRRGLPAGASERGGAARLILALTLLAVLPAHAEETLPDPTRPAFELVPGLAGGTDTASAKDEKPPEGLQSVILSRTREAAIINGSEVERGGKYGDAVLTVVNETCVVLMGPQGRQVMHMFPTVDMSKNELACVKRHEMKTIAKVSQGTRRVNNKKTGAKKAAVVCAPEATKDGSTK